MGQEEGAEAHKTWKHSGVVTRISPIAVAQHRRHSHQGEECGRVSEMSARAPASHPPARWGRTRQLDAARGAALAGVAAALLLIGGAGCNGPLKFHTPMGGTGGGVVVVGDGGSGAGVGGSGVGGSGAGGMGTGGMGTGGMGTGGQPGGSGGVIVPPPDAGPDLPVDVPDVRPDIVEAPPDRPTDVPAPATWKQTAAPTCTATRPLAPASNA